jgi:spore germination protein YaaH
VTFSEGLKYIGAFAFYDCGSLISVAIPASVTSIDNNAFGRCSNLTEIRFEGSAPSFGTSVFAIVTATAYYSAGDPTWTEEVRQNYGGTITWVGYEPEPDHIPGDINGDGNLTNKDVTRLQKLLKGVEVEVNAAALDVNGDGKVTNKDLTRLQRFLKTGDVEIH